MYFLTIAAARALAGRQARVAGGVLVSANRKFSAAPCPYPALSLE